MTKKTPIPSHLSARQLREAEALRENLKRRRQKAPQGPVSENKEQG